MHKLVAIAFIVNPDNKPYINHINKNKSLGDIFGDYIDKTVFEIVQPNNNIIEPSKNKIPKSKKNIKNLLNKNLN